MADRLDSYTQQVSSSTTRSGAARPGMAEVMSLYGSLQPGPNSRDGEDFVMRRRRRVKLCATSIFGFFGAGELSSSLTTTTMGGGGPRSLACLLPRQAPRHPSCSIAAGRFALNSSPPPCAHFCSRPFSPLRLLGHLFWRDKRIPEAPLADIVVFLFSFLLLVLLVGAGINIRRF